MIKNYKTIKEIQEDPSKWGDMLCSQIGKNNTVKTSLLPIPTKISAKFFCRCRCDDSKIYLERHWNKEERERGRDPAGGALPLTLGLVWL